MIKDLIKHNRAQPFATRLAVALATTLNCISVIRGHGTPADVVFGGSYAILSLVVVALTIGKERKLATRLDKICLGISCFGALAFLATGHSVIGITCAILADLVAYVPTIRESRRKPETQPFNTYLISLAAAVTALTANLLYDDLRPTVLFTGYLIFIDTLIPCIILFAKRAQKMAATTELTA